MKQHVKDHFPKLTKFMPNIQRLWAFTWRFFTDLLIYSTFPISYMSQEKTLSTVSKIN